MKRNILMPIAVAFLTAGSMIGHHGYAEYDRSALVSLEGTVKHVLWANPHVVLTLETETRGEYSIEWNALFQLSRQGITAVPVKQGDHLIVTGSVNRNPEKHILTLVQEISRPSDGWHWASPNRTSASSYTK